MDRERQLELIGRFLDLRARRTTDLAEASRRQRASDYTSPEHLEHERDVLFGRTPLLAGLSGDASGPGDYFCFDADRLPLVVVRGEDGILRAMVNVCRHRGAQIAEGRGTAYRRTFVCPFHAWTYDMYGRLLGQPLAKEGFADVDRDAICLREVPAAERHGLIFVGPGDVDTLLKQASDDLAAFGLDRYRHVETRTQVRRLNWKLVIDTFTEAYHIFSLHKETIGPWYHSSPALFDALGPVGLLVGVRRTIEHATDSILPHATILYFVPPNSIVVHQLDHLEVWKSFPGDDPSHARIETSVYAPPDGRDDAYYVRNLDLLMDVTNGEDFPQAERTQRALEAGAVDELIFGRNEPALIHFHATLDALLA